MNKRYEVLDGLPTYGEMAIPIIGDDEIFVSEGYVVKFFKDDGSAWIANFPMGSNQLSFVKEFQNNTIFVVAGGEGYLMNPNYCKPIKEFYDEIESVVERDDGSLIFATIMDVIYLDAKAEIVWIKEDISWDGIKDLKIEDDKLIGYCYDILTNEGENEDPWKKFTINLLTEKIEGGCISFKIIPEKKPWYRYFWVAGFLILLYFQLHR